MVADFYAELELSPDSALPELQDALRQRRRRYRKLTGALDHDQRARAESMMELIARAETAFASEDSRVAYDADLEAHRRERAQAEAAAERARQEAARPTNRAALEQAARFHERGDDKMALRAAAEATSIDHQDPDAWSLRAEYALLAGDIDDAEYAAATEHELRPSVRTILRLADIYVAQGRHEKALGAFIEADQREPGNPGVQSRIGDELLHCERPEDAAQYFEDVARAAGPHDGSWFRRAADIRQQLAQYARAADLYRAASEMSGDARDAAQRVLMLTRAGQHDQAVDLGQRIVESSQDELSARAFCTALLEQAHARMGTTAVGDHHIVSRNQVAFVNETLARMRPHLGRVTDPALLRRVEALREHADYSGRNQPRELGPVGKLLVLVLVLAVLNLGFTVLMDSLNGRSSPGQIALDVVVVALCAFGIYKRVRVKGYQVTRKRIQHELTSGGI